MAAEKNQAIIIKKKKGGGHAGHHGGAWKVAYADFVTAMMAFFLVLWLLGADEEVRVMVSGYFNNPHPEFEGSESLNRNGNMAAGDASQRDDGNSGRFEEALVSNPSSTPPVYLEEQAVISDLKDLTTYEGSAFTQDTRGHQVQLKLPGKIYFTQDSVAIPPTSYSYLNKLAGIIKSYRGQIFIEAQADPSEQAGDESKRWELSFKRAMSVRDYLVNMGQVPSNKIVPTALSPAEIPANDTQNHRVVSMILRHDRPHE